MKRFKISNLVMMNKFEYRSDERAISRESIVPANECSVSVRLCKIMVMILTCLLTYLLTTCIESLNGFTESLVFID